MLIQSVLSETKIWSPFLPFLGGPRNGPSTKNYVRLHILLPLHRSFYLYSNDRSFSTISEESNPKISTSRGLQHYESDFRRHSYSMDLYDSLGSRIYSASTNLLDPKKISIEDELQYFRSSIPINREIVGYHMNVTEERLIVVLKVQTEIYLRCSPFSGNLW